MSLLPIQIATLTLAYGDAKYDSGKYGGRDLAVKAQDAREALDKAIVEHLDLVERTGRNDTLRAQALLFEQYAKAYPDPDDIGAQVYRKCARDLWDLVDNPDRTVPEVRPSPRPHRCQCNMKHDRAAGVCHCDCGREWPPKPEVRVLRDSAGQYLHPGYRCEDFHPGRGHAEWSGMQRS